MQALHHLLQKWTRTSHRFVPAAAPGVLVRRAISTCGTTAMKVYTRTGDAGETSLFNGTRVPKHDVRVDAYGTVDECNAVVGVARAHLQERICVGVTDSSELQKLSDQLASVQNRLFDLGAHLATPRDDASQLKLAKTTFPDDAINDLERWIDEMEEELPKLTTFILPGGHPCAASLHVARTVARRAERMVTPLLSAGGEQIDPCAYKFLNRLSDYFFVASRHANRLTETSDVTWTKRQDTSSL